VPPFSFHAGLPSTTDSKFVKQLRELQESKCIDRIPLIPSTPEEMADMLKLCSYVRFKVPQQVRSTGWLQQPGKRGSELGSGFASPRACVAAAEAMLGAEPALPSPPSARRDTPGPAPSTFPALSLQTHFSQLPLAAPTEIPPPARFLAAGRDVEGLFVNMTGRKH